MGTEFKPTNIPYVILGAGLLWLAGLASMVAARLLQIVLLFPLLSRRTWQRCRPV